MGEPEVPANLQDQGLAFDALTATQSLASMRNPHDPPGLLFRLRNLNLVSQHPIRKRLSLGDVDRKKAHRNAMLIPRNDAEENIMRSLNANENPRDGISIRVFDTYRGDYGLSFAELDDGKYVITHGPADEDTWSDVVRGAGLREGDCIQLWALRHAETHQLCFVVENLREDAG